MDVTLGTSYDNGVLTVGFADDAGKQALLFSRPDTVGEQDSRVGMDTYCISTERGATFYGGVEAAILRGTALDLRLTAAAADALGLPAELLLRFHDEAAVREAAQNLRSIGIAAKSAG
jgi:hypothetical protein